MRLLAAFLLVLAAAGCGGRDEVEPLANEAQSQAERNQNIADSIRRDAENTTGAIERALENETEAIFESRNELLNATADNGMNAAEAKQ